MRKMLATMVLAIGLLVPQVAMAEFHDGAIPFWQRMTTIEMKMGEVKMRMMKSRKMMMTPEQEKKLMKMLEDLEKMLEDILTTKHG